MEKNKTTIVTALWNLGRGEISTNFKRDYENYLKKFADLLKSEIPMYIFIDPSDEDFIWSIRKKENTQIQPMSVEELRSWFSFTELTDSIRKNEDWLSQAGWLQSSPQALLSAYNPAVMSKMFMLNNVTIWNPFNSDYFFWIDAGITNTVNHGYFTHDKVLSNLENFAKINDFIFLTYPYEGGQEIHGFKREEINKYCNTDYVKYVCRGGFFGGNKKTINKVNELYYHCLNQTLNLGLMGTEESIFTILAHNHEDIIKKFPIGSNGLVWPFFEHLKDWDKNYLEKELEKINPKVSLYVITFNSPKQFETLINSIIDYDESFLTKTKKYLLNNSTDLSTTEEYLDLCDTYDFEHIKKDNIGITGGRQWIAEHFDATGDSYYLFFEDDMFFSKEKEGTCRNGFVKYVPELFKKVLNIIKKEKFDFIKLNYSEFYGDNGIQWAWYNVPQIFRESHWPENPKLPLSGLSPNPPRTKFNEINSLDGLPYATGDVYLCNWPIIMSKEGNYKCYLETKYASPYEQTIMSHNYQETIKKNLKPALLLITPTEHNRFDFYDGKLRKEC